jgi:hypothetical protein
MFLGARSVIDRDGWVMRNLFREVGDTQTFRIAVMGETNIRHLSSQASIDRLRWCCGGCGVHAFGEGAKPTSGTLGASTAPDASGLGNVDCGWRIRCYGHMSEWDGHLGWIRRIDDCRDVPTGSEVLPEDGVVGFAYFTMLLDRDCEIKTPVIDINN